MNDHRVVAIGEIGLDYDRTEFCSIEKQLIGFACQMELAFEYNLPIFFHSRNAHSDFMKCVKEVCNKYQHCESSTKSASSTAAMRGVVHSFTGTEEELLEILSFGQNETVNRSTTDTTTGTATGNGNDNTADSDPVGVVDLGDVDSGGHFLYVGFNGCSLKTQESCDLISKVFNTNNTSTNTNTNTSTNSPNMRYINHILLETDAPWCGIKNTHASKRYITNTNSNCNANTNINVPTNGQIGPSVAGATIVSSVFTTATTTGTIADGYLSKLTSYTIKKYDKYKHASNPTGKPTKQAKTKKTAKIAKIESESVPTRPISNPNSNPQFNPNQPPILDETAIGINMRGAMVKDRNEPCTMVHIAQVVTALIASPHGVNGTSSSSNGIGGDGDISSTSVEDFERLEVKSDAGLGLGALDLATLSKIVYENTNRLFKFK